jgi:hypothetical protein
VREFENIGFIDLQKTGTTTIVKALQSILDEKEVYRHVHGPVPAQFDRSKLYFISVREPLSLYISLFNFGSGNKLGALYESLKTQGLGHLFQSTREAFEIWLDFMLDPANAPVLNRRYGEAAPFESVGLLSVRLLYVSLPNFEKRVRRDKIGNPEEIRSLFMKKHIFDEYVRTENLIGDLFAFLRRHSGRLRLRHQLTTAEELAATVRTRNTSKKIPGLSPETVSPALKKRVREREWLFYEVFGYDTDPNGRPPECVLMAASAGVGGQEEGGGDQRAGLAVGSEQT